MSQQAINSINLYRGNDAATIEMALRMQRTSVVNELMEHFRVGTISALAACLAWG